MPGEDASQPGGLLERQSAVAELAGLSRRVTRRSGRMVLLRGEAGVGKTALIARFTDSLDASWRVLRGRCDSLCAESIGQVPYFRAAVAGGDARSGEPRSVETRATDDSS